MYNRTNVRPSDIMTNREERVTLRFSPQELAQMDAFVQKKSELRNRSNLIRTAVREYIRPSRPPTPAQQGKVLIEISENQIEFIRNLVHKESVFSCEAVIFKLLDDFIKSKTMAEIDAHSRLLRQARYENAARDLDEELSNSYLES